MGNIGSFDFPFKVSVVDPTHVYFELMKTLFNFDELKEFVSRKDFNMIFDGMHGVSGPYAKLLFGEVLGVPEANLLRCNVLPDFG
jgi:phosphoglucomutase